MEIERSLYLLVSLIASLAVASSAGADPVWKPVPEKMMTTWGSEVTPENAWSEYPRPQFERPDWQNLNGLWDYAITAIDADKPAEWEGKILVPYAIESTLSGIGKLLTPQQALWYHRTLSLTPKPNHRTLLNFEAVDYQSTVWLNGRQVGKHTGGNTPFSFDVTDALKPDSNEIIVRIEDATGRSQLRGKQAITPKGIFYTRVSGIWQTVWLEQVPARHIESIKIGTTIKPAAITITPLLAGVSGTGEKVRVTASFKGTDIATSEGNGEVKINLPDPKLWSPAFPNLYDLTLDLIDAQGVVSDTVKSYAGVREIGQKRDASGNLRFTLNGEEIFHWGPLDQGWWPDGLLTPPSDAANPFFPALRSSPTAISGAFRKKQIPSSTLRSVSNTYAYVDVAHAAWLGWASNLKPFAALLKKVGSGIPGGNSKVDGFISNTANYNVFVESYMTGNQKIGKRTVRSLRGWYDSNDSIDEQSYGNALRNQLISGDDAYPARVGLLLDTSRNGWGGPNRPTGPSTSTDLREFVRATTLDRRIHKGNWGNQNGAGIGARPVANPAPNYHAFVWVKPPGFSDGSSSLIPTGPDNPTGKGFDRMCDPTYHGNSLNARSLTGALPNAPVAGRWFQAQFVQLVENAFPEF